MVNTGTVIMVLSPFWKSAYYKRKELASKGAFFPFRTDLFSEGGSVLEVQQEVT